MSIDNKQSRLSTLKIVVYLIFALLLGRIFYLQFINSDYDSLSKRNVLRREVIYAARGEVVDRNGELLVRNNGCYDVMVTYRDMDRNGFDTLQVCELLDITPKRLSWALDNARLHPRVPYMETNHLSTNNKLRLDELNITGFRTVFRTVRGEYPLKIGGNLLGHIGEINERQLKQNPDYQRGDYIGIGGIESAYEQTLRGVKGSRIVEVNTHGVVQQPHMDGVFDTIPIHGGRLISTIDSRLQLLGEQLMQGKVGAAVAIEPSTGEILMMVSSPTFDPERLVGRQRGNNYMDLLNDPRHPLFNRAVTSKYPPGSVFKMLQGLIGLQEGVLNRRQHYYCYGGFDYWDRTLKCHEHKPYTSLEYAVATSCNTYFCNVFYNILSKDKEEQTMGERYTSWRDDVMSFGFGRKLGSDFLGEGSGYIPEASYYDRIYRGSWNPLTIISLSIGQGELGCTPLQMANFAAILANRGYYYIPHIIREVEGEGGVVPKFRERQYSSVDSIHFEPIIQGMWDGVNVEGSKLARIEGWDVCGKTGTAQNPNGEDHSTFLSFAPRNNPKIAISVYVEHGGWGASSAMPIASLIQELYLTDTIQRQWLVDYIIDKKIEYPMYDGE